MDQKAAKAKAMRIKRLATMLSTGLSNPLSAIDALIAELKLGEEHPHLWEGLHAAASDGKESELADAYRRLTTGRRFKELDAPVQSQVLIHAAHFSQGIMGDIETAERYFKEALSVVPDNLEVFARLEAKYESMEDKRPLLELYAVVARRPPKPAGHLGGRAVNLIVPLPAKMPISDEVCVALSALVPAAPSLLAALERHCQKTGRAALICDLIERALDGENVAASLNVEWRRRLVELYTVDAKAPDKALPHIEALLLRDPNDKAAREAIKRIVLLPKVGEKLQTLLKEIRRAGLNV